MIHGHFNELDHNHIQVVHFQLFSLVWSALMPPNSRLAVNAELKRSDRRWWTEMGGEKWHKTWSEASVAMRLDFFYSFTHQLCSSRLLPIRLLCSIPPLVAFEVPSFQVQNAVSWESGGEEGRGKTPTTSKGFSWVVGRWGLFLACWCPLKGLSWRWKKKGR